MENIWRRGGEARVAFAWIYNVATFCAVELLLNLMNLADSKIKGPAYAAYDWLAKKQKERMRFVTPILLPGEKERVFSAGEGCHMKTSYSIFACALNPDARKGSTADVDYMCVENELYTDTNRRDLGCDRWIDVKWYDEGDHTKGIKIDTNIYEPTSTRIGNYKIELNNQTSYTVTVVFSYTHYQNRNDTKTELHVVNSMEKVTCYTYTDYIVTGIAVTKAERVAADKSTYAVQQKACPHPELAEGATSMVCGEFLPTTTNANRDKDHVWELWESSASCGGKGIVLKRDDVIRDTASGNYKIELNNQTSWTVKAKFSDIDEKSNTIGISESTIAPSQKVTLCTRGFVGGIAIVEAIKNGTSFPKKPCPKPAAVKITDMVCGELEIQDKAKDHVWELWEDPIKSGIGTQIKLKRDDVVRDKNPVQ